MPHGVRDGSHYAGVVATKASSPGPSANGAGRGPSSFRVVSVVRLAVPITVRLPGPHARGLALGDVALPVDATGASLTLAVANTGNVLIRRASADLRVQRGHRTLFRYRAVLGELLPDSPLALRIPWQGTPMRGTYRVVGTIRPRDADPLRVDAPVTFTTRTADELERRAEQVTLPESSVPVLVWAALALDYPLTTLMLAGVRDILIISTPIDTPRFIELMGDGSQWGVSLSYAVQDKPRGLAHAFIVARSFIGDDDCMMILGDNIFFGSELSRLIRTAIRANAGATIFAYPVKDPERFGVIEFDKQRRPTRIVEKPTEPRSNFAVTGMYVYDNDVVRIAEELTPSARGELEITDLNMRYLTNGRLAVMHMGRGMAWLDTGTHEALLEASHFVQTIEHRQGLKIACPEEVAWRLSWIDDAALERTAGEIGSSSYAEYLTDLLRDARSNGPVDGGSTGSAFWDAIVSDGHSSSRPG